jgi:L-amino acid N-acyltransferase YncA
MFDERRCRIWDGRPETGAADIRVRDAADVDLAATAQLEPIIIDRCGAWLRSGFPLCVAEIEGRVAGWLSCKPFLPRCVYRGTVEVSMYVDENFRRRGVARQLLQHAIVRGPLLGIGTMSWADLRRRCSESAIVRTGGIRLLGITSACRSGR